MQGTDWNHLNAGSLVKCDFLGMEFNSLLPGRVCGRFKLSSTLYQPLEMELTVEDPFNAEESLVQSSTARNAVSGEGVALLGYGPFPMSVHMLEHLMEP